MKCSANGLSATILLVLAPLPIFALGVALLIAPARTTAALNEWYILPPAVGTNHHILLTLVRASGIGLMVLAIGLEVRAIDLVVALAS